MNTIQTNQPFEIGIYTLADIAKNPITGKTISAGGRIHEIIEAAKLADEAGLDVFGVGEHHREQHTDKPEALSKKLITGKAISHQRRR